MRMRWAWVLLVIAVGCGDGTRARPTGGVRPGDAGTRDTGPSGGADAADPTDAEVSADAGTGDAGPSADAGVRDAGRPVDAGSPDAGEPAVPYCRQTCGSPGDCATPGNMLADADNYACTQGECQYLGCNGDSECRATFMSDGYVCRSASAGQAPSCVKVCSAAADCASPSPLVDEDNYRCTQGGCEWTGCRSTQECVDTFQDARWVCEPSPAGGPANCVRTCLQPSDCVQGTSPAYDGDNYACVGSRCVYAGCNSAQECMESFVTGTYQCR